MTTDMTTIHPDEDAKGEWTETYQYEFDDSCLVVRSGRDKDTKKTWLSQSMIEWISTHGKEAYYSHYQDKRPRVGYPCATCGKHEQFILWQVLTCDKCNPIMTWIVKFICKIQNKRHWRKK